MNPRDVVQRIAQRLAKGESEEAIADDLVAGVENLTVITVRMPRELHKRLKTEARERRVSLNRLCVERLDRAAPATVEERVFTLLKSYGVPRKPAVIAAELGLAPDVVLVVLKRGEQFEQTPEGWRIATRGDGSA